MRIRLLTALLLIVPGLLLAQPSNTAPRHVFLFIGDGMGELQAEATERALAARPAPALAFRAFAVAGRQRTRSSNNEVTDSAAAATAMACGVRTRNGVLGLTAGGEAAPSIAALAHARGWKVGILSSVSLDHATPAGFYAHEGSRGSVTNIARALADSPFDFFGGGGLAGQQGQPGGQDNLQRAISNGFVVARTRTALAAMPAGARVYAFNHRLAGGAALPWAIEAGPNDVSLAEFTAAAIRQLRGKPFFMMVEGGKIDWACHANDLGAAVRETQAFGEAVREAVAFARENPDDTLIVVTGDHETGGLTRLADATGAPAALLGQTLTAESFSGHVKAMTERKADFAEVRDAVQRSFGLADLTEAEQAVLQQAWQDTQAGVKNTSLYGKANPVAVTAARQLAARAGYRFTTGGHSGVDLPVYAMGAGAEAFAGTYDNTEIFARLQRLMLPAAEAVATPLR